MTLPRVPSSFSSTLSRHQSMPSKFDEKLKCFQNTDCALHSLKSLSSMQSLLTKYDNFIWSFSETLRVVTTRTMLSISKKEKLLTINLNYSKQKYSEMEYTLQELNKKCTADLDSQKYFLILSRRLERLLIHFKRLIEFTEQKTTEYRQHRH